MTYLLIIATGYGDIMAFTLQSIIHIGAIVPMPTT